jgi:site-specific recombinase XerD
MSAKTKLKHSLIQILKRDNTGSHGSRHDRRGMLLHFAKDLVFLGFKVTNVNELRTKHIYAVVSSWQKSQLKISTIKNRISAIRHLSLLLNKPQLVPSNADLNTGSRKYINNRNRALFNPNFNNITNDHVRISLELQRVFGLRREESIKIKPHLADKGNQLELMPTWCKGGRGRFVPIQTAEQRYWLERAKEVAGNFGNSLIPEDKNYIQQRYVYDKQVLRAGLRNLHGLRHAYAQQLYKELAGWDAPINGGPKWTELTLEQKKIDHRARLILTEQLGHSRKQITNSYLNIAISQEAT